MQLCKCANFFDVQMMDMKCGGVDFFNAQADDIWDDRDFRLLTSDL